MFKLIKIITALSMLLPAGVQAEVYTTPSRCRLWVDIYRGEPVRFDEMMEDITGADILYIGEIHSLKRHHESQRRILEDLYGRGRQVVLCIEQMEAFNQPHLDRYAAGEISFEELAKRTDWPNRWSNYADYRELLETARRKGSAIRALNVREETARAVARKGLGSIPEELRAGVPNIGPSEPLYEKKIMRLLEVHAFAHPENIRFIFEAQALRDEVMAKHAADALARISGKNGMAVVVGGAAHFSYGLGVPSRVKRRIPGIKDRIVLLSESGDLTLSIHEKRIAREITNTHEAIRFLGVPAADYIEATEQAQP
jgi:uncharacterized iron-regulated protein